MVDKRLFWHMIVCVISIVFFDQSWCVPVRQITEKSIVVIIPSYNNAQWYKRNLDSVFAQKYSNFRIIYCEDCWTVGAGLVQDYKDEYDNDNRMTLISNDTRRGAMANLYDAIHSCDDNAIIVVLDGDDWFANDRVLATINRYYADPDVWLTYGSMRPAPNTIHYPRLPFLHDVIKNNNYRSCRWVAFHPRTFYVWLFKRIKKEDLMYEGRFVPMTYDQAMMFPMFEMSGGRFTVIKEILCVYNRFNLINVDKVNRALQVKIEEYIRSLPRYESIGSILLRS